MAKRNKGIGNSVFRIDSEYYTFISGALISIPLSLFFELAENYKEIAFWIALVSSLLSSLFCFKLSIFLKEVKKTYDENTNGVGNTTSAWESAFNNKKSSFTKYLILTIVMLVIAIICTALMQFIDTTVTPTLIETFSHPVSSIQ